MAIDSTLLRLIAGWLLLVSSATKDAAAASPTLMVPDAQSTVHLAVPLAPPKSPARGWRLVDQADQRRAIPVDLMPAADPRGLPQTDRRVLSASIPAGGATNTLRRFRLEPAKGPRLHGKRLGFRFEPVDTNSLALWEGIRPVFVYNHGILRRAGVPEDRARSTYLHPVYDLDGCVLTDDFPPDHYHHRGLFWAWPHVNVDGRGYDLWMFTNIQQRFERWLAREPASGAATLAVENGWYVGARKIVQERVWIRAFAATRDERVVDLDFTWIPLERSVALAGAEGKSYGGLTLRFAPRAGTVITTPLGQGTEDLAMTRLPWADLSAIFAGASAPSGVAIFIAPEHPDYPPTWLTRHYGVLCVGWPGVQAETFPPNQPIRCRYRLWIHRSSGSVADVARAYAGFESAGRAAWETSPGK